MVEHVNIADADLHEPKGVALASAGESYVADGLGSGAWSPRFYTISGKITDVSTSDIEYHPIPYSGTVVKVLTVLGGVITTADATITIRNSAGASMGTIVVTQTGSAAGDVDVNSSLSNNSVADDSFLSVETDGGSTGTTEISFLIVIERDD